MDNECGPTARNQADIRYDYIAARNYIAARTSLADRVTSDTWERTAASSADQAPDCVGRALLSDEAVQAWLANLLREQRESSERQIKRQHEMLRDHVCATLQACLRPIMQALAEGAPGGGRRPGAPGSSWDPDNWELDFDGGGRRIPSRSRIGEEPRPHAQGRDEDFSDFSDFTQEENTSSTIEANLYKADRAKAVDSKAGQKSSGPGDTPAPGTSSGSKSSDTRAQQESSSKRQTSTSSYQQATRLTTSERSSRSRLGEQSKAKEQVDEVDLRNSRLPADCRILRSKGSGEELAASECEQVGLVEWLMGMPLDIAAVSLIIANTLCMMVHSMWVGYTVRVRLGLEAGGSWQGAEEVFDIAEVTFTVLFLMELIARLCWDGLKLLKDPLNAVDAFVVMITTLDSFVFSRFDFKAGISAIRLIRMLKLGKTFRFAKALKMIEPLRILLKTITASVSSLVWSMCILFLFMLVAAILASQMIQGYIGEDANDMEMRLWCDHHYGNVLKALWTMFMITMSGGWPAWVSPLVHEVSIGYAVLFGTYVTLVVFAVIRVITALFLKETLAQAAKDADQLFKERMSKKGATIGKLTEIFNLADANGDNTLCEQEFNRAIHDPAIVKLFYELEMEPGDLSGIFHLLDDGNAEVELDEFLSGIMKMKGLSRATDLLILQHDNRKMLAALAELRDLVAGS